MYQWMIVNLWEKIGDGSEDRLIAEAKKYHDTPLIPRQYSREPAILLQSPTGLNPHRHNSEETLDSESYYH